MIGYLSGKVQHREPQGNLDQVILTVSGVGYIVQCPSGVIQCELGENAEIWIHSITREDGTRLYGFADIGDIRGFVKMLEVQGVGAKVAMALIAALGWQGLLAAITTQDSAQLTRADGVGKKLAERIVHELSAKLGSLGGTGSMTPSPASPSQNTSKSADAVSALVNLGYSGILAHETVRTVQKDNPAMPLEEIITQALRSLNETAKR